MWRLRPTGHCEEAVIEAARGTLAPWSLSETLCGEGCRLSGSGLLQYRKEGRGGEGRGSRAFTTGSQEERKRRSTRKREMRRQTEGTANSCGAAYSPEAAEEGDEEGAE